MPYEMLRCKITVLKRTINQDLIDEYLDDTSKDIGPCEAFEDRQEFVIETPDELSKVPEGFCAWAWADIRKDILTIQVGGDMPGMKRRGIAITGCTIQHTHNAPDSANIRIMGEGKARPYAEGELRGGNITITGNILSDVQVNVHLQKVSVQVIYLRIID